MSGGVRDLERPPPKKLEWDWDLEHRDRAKEAKADRAVHHAQPFHVDRSVLKDVVKEKFKVDVARIVFLSSGASYVSTELIPRSQALHRYRRHVPQGTSEPWAPSKTTSLMTVQAYQVTLVDGFQLVARVARRFMPRIKTESEVATMDFLRKHTNFPVPFVYHHDASAYNRLGGEYILMSKVMTSSTLPVALHDLNGSLILDRQPGSLFPKSITPCPIITS